MLYIAALATVLGCAYLWARSRGAKGAGGMWQVLWDSSAEPVGEGRRWNVMFEHTSTSDSRDMGVMSRVQAAWADVVIGVWGTVAGGVGQAAWSP